MARVYQATIGESVTFRGVGVHSGKPVSMTINPAPFNHGIVFLKSDEHGGVSEISAEFDAVSATELCTVLGDEFSGTISTVEHLLAALNAYGVDNALIDIDADEAPILDGSSWPFVEGIERAGVVRQDEPRRYIRILKPILVERGASRGALLPFNGMRYEVEIDFESPLIGNQLYSFDLSAEGFRRRIARARTFGFVKDVEKLRAMGFAKGASLDNTVALGDDRVLNPGGLRFPDEFARHKILDAIGDLSLSGMPILGLYRAVRPGHRLNFSLLQALFADEDAWTMAQFAPSRRRRVTTGYASSPAFAAAA